MAPLITQSIIPAIRNMREFEHLLRTDYEYLVLLNVHVAGVRAVVQRAAQDGKKMILHADLIEGLKSDEYAAEFIAQEVRPAGIISTRHNMLLTAKKKGLIAIQRLFLLDTMALDNSYVHLEKTKPDYVEVLPGVIPHIIREFYEKAKVPVIAGGLIRSQDEVQQALQAGAVAVTTSRKELWTAR
ncbi:glycerol-3-phosphate responsive antiterminator [Paenibacillus sp. GCM10023252]|uniref:glycerol-3-phosphate responsive antiterminator n=1 Tax=Paenibacillus sp. GCM10023252 TaxID=3252649 RepID=UPI0036185255